MPTFPLRGYIRIRRPITKIITTMTHEHETMNPDNEGIYLGMWLGLGMHLGMLLVLDRLHNQLKKK